MASEPERKNAMSEKMKPWESDPELAKVIAPVVGAMEEKKAEILARKQADKRLIRDLLPAPMLPYLNQGTDESVLLIPGLAPIEVRSTWNNLMACYVYTVARNEASGAPEWRNWDDEARNLGEALEMAIKRAEGFDEQMAAYQKDHFGRKKKKKAPETEVDQVAPLVTVAMGELIKVIRDVVTEMKESGEI